jgi:hypothetical protein
MIIIKKVFSLKGAIVLLSFFFTMLCEEMIYAQTNVNLGYYDFNTTSRNIVLWVDKTYQEKHVFGAGIKYHLDDPIRSDFSNGLNYRSISANKWYQHIGFMTQYQRSFLWNHKKLKPFLFYNFQATYGFRKQDGFYDWASGRWRKKLLVDEMYLFENQIGFGIDFYLSKKIRFYLNAGIGLVFYWYMNQPLVEKKFLNVTTTNRDFDRMFSGGIKYELIPPLKKLKVKELSYASEDINNYL